MGVGKNPHGGSRYVHLAKRNLNLLVVCPKALVGNWERFRDEAGFYFEIIPYGLLARHKQFAEVTGYRKTSKKLVCPIEKYHFVVVDEAHNFRNKNTKHLHPVIRHLIKASGADCLFLTATPINNALHDLVNLLELYIPHDGHFADIFIPSYQRLFDAAAHEDPINLNPDMLAPVMDATTVKRDQRHLKMFHEEEFIRSPKGKIKVDFPETHALDARYPIDGGLEKLFGMLKVALHSDGKSQIGFTRYMAEKHLLKDVVPDDETINAEPERKVKASIKRKQGIIGLMRCGLLKRFESSPYAFGQTLHKYAEQHRMFLSQLDNGWVVSTDFLNHVYGDDEAPWNRHWRNRKTKGQPNSMTLPPSKEKSGKTFPKSKNYRWSLTGWSAT